jgi:hypothetical protein
VASGVCDAREIARARTGIAWTMLLLTIKLGACLDLSGHFCNTLQHFYAYRHYLLQVVGP